MITRQDRIRESRKFNAERSRYIPIIEYPYTKENYLFGNIFSIKLLDFGADKS